MSCVFRHHLSSTQAHIVAGILNSNGVTAAVAGDIADQIYGGVPMLDCVVIVPEEELEEAEAVLRTDFPDEPPDTDIPAESCPPDGDPPGVGPILCGMLWLAPIAALAPALLTGLQIFSTRPRTLQPILERIVFTYLHTLLGLMVLVPVYAIGAGLLLRIIRGYRNGSRACRVIVKIILLLMIL